MDKNSGKELLRHLDILKPVCALNIVVIRLAMEKLLCFQNSATIELDDYEMNVDEIHVFFPDCKSQILPVVEMLSFTKPGLSSRVFLLDILTILTILVQGTLGEKAKYLFLWYNFSGTGLLNELEHSILISRTSKCLHRIKLLGTIEITRDDARYSALCARVKYDGSKMRFLPGLDFDEFYDWIRNSDESKAIFIFFRTFERLVDTILTLQNRTSGVFAIMKNKAGHRPFDFNVPRIEFIKPWIEDDSRLSIVYCCANTVSMSIFLPTLNRFTECIVYARVELLKPVVSPLYEMPLTTHHRVFSERTLPSACCSKQHGLVSHQFTHLSQQLVLDSCPMLRIDLTDLEPSSKYVIQLYTECRKFRELQVQTSTRTAIDQLSTFGKLDHNASEVSCSLCVLPGTLSILDATEFVASTPQLLHCDCTVFTGNLCSIDQLLREALLLIRMDTARADDVSCSNSLVASVQARYLAHWQKAVEDLFNLRNASASMHSRRLTGSVSFKHLLYFFGIDPISSGDIRNELRGALGQRLFSLLSAKVATLYYRYAQCVLPPTFFWTKDPFKVVFLRNNSTECFDAEAGRSNGSKHDAEDSSAAVSVATFCDWLEEWIAIEAGLGQAHPQHLVVLMRNPLDCFRTIDASAPLEGASGLNLATGGDPIDAIVEEVVAAPSAPSAPAAAAAAAAAAVVAPAVAPAAVAARPQPIRGRHEIMHGEYSATVRPAAAPPSGDHSHSQSQSQLSSQKSVEGDREQTVRSKEQTQSTRQFTTGDVDFKVPDAAFHKMVRLLMVWVRCGAGPDNRRVTLISTGWHQGRNFEIWNRSGRRDQSMVVIRHESLLATQVDRSDSGPGNPRWAQTDSCGGGGGGGYDDGILKRIRDSLPEGMTLEKLPASKERAVVFDHRSHSLSVDSSFGGLMTIDEPSFLPVNKIADKTLDPCIATTLPQLNIVNGPRIMNITEQEVLVTIVAEGYGILTASIYDLPLHTDYSDAVAFTDAERKGMHKLQSVKKRCVKRREVAIRFTGLEANRCYCIAVDPWSTVPHVAHFRTLYSQQHPINSVVVSATSNEDYALPSLPMDKIATIVDGLRPRATPIYLLHHASRNRNKQTGLIKAARRDIAMLYKRANVIHALDDLKSASSSTLYRAMASQNPGHLSSKYKMLQYGLGFDSSIDKVHVVYNGTFLSIAPRDASGDCIRVLLDVVRLANFEYPEAQNLTTFVPQPIIRFLERGRNGKWSCNGPAITHKDDCSALLRAMLEWKSCDPNRDCQILCVADVTLVKVVTIGYADFQDPSALQSFDEFLNADSFLVATSLPDGSLSEGFLPLGGDLASMGSVSLLDSSVDSTPAPPISGVTIRHLLIPAIVGGAAGRTSTVAFPVGRWRIGGDMQYEIEHNPVSLSEEFEVHFKAPREDLHGHSIPLGVAAERVPYIIDTFVVPSKGNARIAIDSLEVGTVELETAGAPRARFAAEVKEQPDQKRGPSFVYNPVVLRPIVHGIDLVEVIMGPVMGLVTQVKARIMFEVNKDVRQVECVLRAAAFPDEPFSLVHTRVKAYKCIIFCFENLISGRKYNIYLPGLCGDVVLGSFRTGPVASAFAQIAFTGNRPFDNLPLVEDIIAQLRDHQCVDLSHHSARTQFMYGADIAFPEERRRYEPKSDHRRTNKDNRRSNSWIWLSEHLRNPLMPTSAVFHLGGTTLMPHIIHRIVDALLDHGRRLVLPLRDANAVGAWYFVQFEEIIKDTLRLAWSIPSVKDAMSVASHIPIYHSKFLLPLDADSIRQHVDAEVDKKLMQIIRKVFETNFMNYLPPLYDWNVDTVHHASMWRSGTLAVITLDIVTDRKKLRKPGAAESKKPPETPTGGGKHIFSAGFLDKNQWKLLKNLADDKSITHLIICTQKPIIPLTEIARSFEAPALVPKGEMIEWRPTINDLEFFLKYLIDWMKPGATESSPVSKNVALLSTHPIPHTTVVQDLSNGLKIQQMCVGDFNVPSIENFEPVLHDDDLILSGKIGGLRYSHKFGGLDDVIVDSSREGEGAGRSDWTPDCMQSPKVGFAVLKMWFDSWKATGVWSFVTETQGASKPPGVALLVVGPVLGVPYIVKKSKGENYMVLPVLVEVDRRTTITFVATDAFTSETFSWNFNLKHNRPTVCKIGPLVLARRYNARITGGIRNGHIADFVISTHINWGEANIVVLNSDVAAPGVSPCSSHIKDLVQRCRVPFNGITALLNINFQPDPQILDEIKVLPMFVTGLEACKAERRLTSRFRKYMREVLERVRDQYRNLFSRPSYRELLKCSYNLMMQTRSFASQMGTDDSLAGRMIAIMLEAVGYQYLQQLTWHSHFDNHEDPNVIEDDEDDENGDDDQTLISATIQASGTATAGKASSTAVAGNVELESNGVPSLSQESQSVLNTKRKYPSLIDKIFEKWMSELDAEPSRQLPPPWKTWVAPNGIVTVEAIQDVNKDTLDDVKKQLEHSEIEYGNRIVVLTGGLTGDDFDAIMSNKDSIGLKFQKVVLHWAESRHDRFINVVIPSRQEGTAQHSIQFVERGDYTSILTVDSIFRCTDYVRERLLLDRVARAKAQIGQTTSAGGKSKKAMARKAEEERRLIEFTTMQVNEELRSAKPDGFFIIECRSSTLESPSGVADLLTDVRYTNVGSVGGAGDDERDVHSLFDYIQLPDWLYKFIPGLDGVFLQDEVALVMRQDPEIQRVLTVIEGDELAVQVMQMYERSRLSELSRPPELREVDMDQPGVIPLFLRDLVERVWDEVVPPEIKLHMISLEDEFIRSYALSRAMPDPATLTTAPLFAYAMQKTLSVVTAFMMAMKMKDMEQWEFIMQLPDEPTRVANAEQAWDKKVALALDQAKAKDPYNFDSSAVIAGLEAKRSKIVDYESDVEDLDREEKEDELQEQMNEEEEERKARLAELKAEEDNELAQLEEPIVESEADANVSSEVAQLRSEAKRVKMEFKRMELNCLKASFEELMVSTLDELIEQALAEMLGTESGEAQVDETEEKRIEAAKQQMARLAKARVDARRALGLRLTYLSGSFI